MAKRTRAPARRERAARQRRREIAEETADETTHTPACAKIEQAYATRRRVYTPELLAFLRHRFEQTDDTLSEIGAASGIHRDTVTNIAKRLKWNRYVIPPQGLPPAVMLLAEAEALEQNQELQSGKNGTGTSGDDKATPQLVETIARLHRLVLGELEELESRRRQSNRRLRGAATAVRTLSALTETLQKLQRLQPDHANSGPNDDDMPSDIDEFRIDLARRIEAFVAEWNDAGAGGEPGPPPKAAEV